MMLLHDAALTVMLLALYCFVGYLVWWSDDTSLNS